MLHVRNLTYRIGGRTIIDGASVHVPKGHRCGLVGINGSGKTTLFRLITGELMPDDGIVQVSGSARIGIVEQEAPSSEESLLTLVLAADTDLHALQAEAASNPPPHRLAEIYERLKDMNAHSATSRAASILAGLGFDDSAQARPCCEFSGGWRMRVALACTLYSRPDLLLLDEPTNHLDLESSLWLESYLARFPGTLIVISHDRGLLNRSINKIVHLESGKLHTYQGGYDNFRKKTTELGIQRQSARNKQLKERARIQGFVDKFRAKATKARQAQSRIKLLEKMVPLVETIEAKSAPLHFPQPKTFLPPPLATLSNLSIGYGEHIVLRNLNLQVDPDDRIAILGANGLGKSTLIKLFAGKLSPIHGQLQHSSKLNIGYFSQHQTDELSDGSTPYEILTHHMPRAMEEKVRSHLGAFGFSGSKADNTVETLSGGEKSRLLFCLMSQSAPNLLLLDEPTNHLDITARETLVASLNDYTGAVILVSHDAHIVNLIADRLWLVSDGTCYPYDGTLDNYRESLAQAKSVSKQNNSSLPSNSVQPQKRKRKQRVEARKNKTELRLIAKSSENKISELSEIIRELEAKLSEPSTYNSHAKEVATISKKLDKARTLLSIEEKKWISAQEQLDP